MVLTARGPLSFLAAIAASGVVMLAATPAALAKEGVVAKLTTPFPGNAAPGARITVAWTLSSFDQDGRLQPFNAEGVFVRLLSATRDTPSMAYASNNATGHPTGEYRAEVTVPAGGVGEVQIGIMGSSEVLFPLQDALSGIRSAEAPRPTAASQARPSVVPAIVAGAASLLILGLLLRAVRARSTSA